LECYFQNQEMENMRELEAQADEAERLHQRNLESEEMRMRQLEAKREYLSSLQRQLDEIRQREDEAKELEKEEMKLAYELNKLECLDRERKSIEEKCKRELHGKALLRQHQAALRRRSAEVQAELEADLKWLSQLSEQNQIEDQKRISKREQERDSLATMRERIQSELDLERKQEIELDALQSHEAARLWSKREEEWRKESEARQKLLQEVLEDRRNQLCQRIEYNRRRQQEELETRESLLEALEKAHQNGMEESQNGFSAIETQRRELESQIAENREMRLEARRNAEAEAKVSREAERAYEEMLRQEAEKMKISDSNRKTAISTIPTRSGDTSATVIQSRPGGNIW
uniref:Trichoplein keratin filament-binding protein n=1 Tax=Echinostoma caproni TaxID=27848 RepID=A0A183AMC5_9TREM